MWFYTKLYFSSFSHHADPPCSLWVTAHRTGPVNGPSQVASRFRSWHYASILACMEVCMFKTHAWPSCVFCWTNFHEVDFIWNSYWVASPARNRATSVLQQWPHPTVEGGLNRGTVTLQWHGISTENRFPPIQSSKHLALVRGIHQPQKQEGRSRRYSSKSHKTASSACTSCRPFWGLCIWFGAGRVVCG